MRKAQFAVSGLLSALVLTSSLHCVAQAVDISACQTIQDRLQRYACYDGIDTAGTVAPRREAPVSRSNEQEGSEDRGSLLGRIFDRDDTAEAAQPAATPAAEPDAASSVDTFGRNTGNARVLEGSDGKTELVDTIAALEQRGPQLWLITLKSGQQWRQMLSKRYRLKVGDEVRIYPTRWGSSYRLSASRIDGYIQVERVD